MTTDRMIKAFLRSDRLADRVQLGLRGVFDGVWLGLLSPERLVRIDQAYFSASPEYTTEDHNRSGLRPWEQSAIERHFAGVRRIVVTSAGGGREMIALAKAGHEVLGYEPHPDLARFGAQLLESDGIDAILERCDRDVWPAQGVQADGVVVGWAGYMHIPGRARRVEFLRDAAEHLPDGAPILVSFLATDRHDGRFRTAVCVANPLRRLLRRAPIDVGDALVPFLVHSFTRDQIEAELSDGGFDLVDFGTEGYGWAVGRTRPNHKEDSHV